ncbi:MAG: Gfo/Idh/MocA family oxidoreductase [Tabrizicola sp.]|uniref:Gfo/Idh/MocA family protein n=1 Tax=Tabrizicola sp. TaxID=2005166 RepID=UPI00273442EB|nr:Gfo/Idh/MocA family oxidoreductase [Tabrizicola sp.]MDP3262103.1 Gfo/Idh/MocA family oxidoreductase [Tabrizicola sp.]MDP3648151.1 Gfo/Idh/MocA family oxidoreductase [Paracoccaceae bacterium]MDZ4069688.1 Gfo/Idh/MocA family oxidoreductase [Tabrizicola sp.]
MTKPKLRIGLIGTGFMGKAHVFGFTSAPRVFELPFDLELHTVADITDEAAERARQTLGFADATSDWRTIMANPEIDLVSITAPNALHKEMSLAAIAAGKHVYCEKPLAPLAGDALDMTLAAEARGVKTQVGFNYLCNPMLALARDMIAGGELGEIRGYRGIHCEDYMADPSGSYTFRHDPAGGGALADIGSHALATAEFLVGPITRVMGDLVTMIAERPDGRGGRKAVMVDDVGRAFLRFDNGATGSIEGNWIATGRKMQHDFEVYGTKGALAFSQEHFNVINFFSTADAKGRQGFRRIEASPDHAPYGLFCVAAGHQIGFNDLKAIEVAGYINAIAGKAPEPFNFRKGLRIQTLVETIQTSSREGRWIDVQ